LHITHGCVCTVIAGAEDFYLALHRKSLLTPGLDQ
jgi:hypothetical protein